MNKRQLIILWVIGIVISAIALLVISEWRYIKYPFHWFLLISLPVVIIGALLFYTIGKVEHPLKWFHRNGRRKFLLKILVLLSAIGLVGLVVFYGESFETKHRTGIKRIRRAR